jgi:molybdenum cofactor cytidylyltransferase
VKGSVAAVVLAAGESRRMGQPKLTMPFKGTTIIEWTVHNVLGSSADEVLIVTGHDELRISGLFKQKPVRLVHNAEYMRGMVTSIIAGMEAASPEMVAILVLPGDQPTITSSTINAILIAFRSSDKGIAVPVYQGRTGHPAIFSRKYRDELTGLNDQGARALVYGHCEDVLRVDVDAPEVRIDIDTLADYNRIAWAGDLSNDQLGQV